MKIDREFWRRVYAAAALIGLITVATDEHGDPLSPESMAHLAREVADRMVAEMEGSSE